MRAFIIILIAAILLAAVPAHAGGAKDAAVGGIYGAAFGVCASGIGMIFLSDAEDEHYINFMWAGLGLGMITGVTYGLSLPDETESDGQEINAQPSAILNFHTQKEMWEIEPFALLPQIYVAPSGADFAISANVFKIDF